MFRHKSNKLKMFKAKTDKSKKRITKLGGFGNCNLLIVVLPTKPKIKIERSAAVNL